MTMTESIKEKLYTRHLPEPLYIKGFVHNEGNCNYEIYLRELLNASGFFQKNQMERSIGNQIVSMMGKMMHRQEDMNWTLNCLKDRV